MLFGAIRDQQFISGKLGIVADPPGGGKTLSVLAFLASEEPQTRQAIGELHPQSNRFFSSHMVPTSTDISSVNVIVVPPTLLQQWQDEIKQHTRLNPFIIQNRRVLRNRGTPQAILESHFILTTNRMYREVHAYCQEHNLGWKNLFFDEASNIYLSPNDPIPNAAFLWFITSQWHHMLFKNIHAPLPIGGDFHPDFLAWASQHGTSLFCATDAAAFYRAILPWTHPERSCLVLKNRGFEYPSITYNTIECRSQYTLANLPISVLGTNYSGLTHEAIPNIFAALGLQSMTVSQIKHVHGREELIDSTLKNDCSICLDAPQNTVVLPCCMNVFCGACILRQLIMHAQCPMCRSLLVLPCLLPITSQAEPVVPIKLTKQETCIQQILKHPDASYVVYTQYENTFYQIQPYLNQKGIGAEALDMPLNRFHKTLQRFNLGETKVLFVSNVDLVRGLNLSKATYLIFFYELSVYERQQILIHSIARLGQKQKTVIRLKASMD